MRGCMAQGRNDGSADAGADRGRGERRASKRLNQVARSKGKHKERSAGTLGWMWLVDQSKARTGANVNILEQMGWRPTD